MDVVDCEWGAGADLDILKKKLEADKSHSVKAVCVVHNETSTGVTNDIGAVRKIVGEYTASLLSFQNFSRLKLGSEPETLPLYICIVLTTSIILPISPYTLRTSAGTLCKCSCI